MFDYEMTPEEEQRARQEMQDEQWLHPWAKNAIASPGNEGRGRAAGEATLPDEAPSDMADAFYLRAAKNGLTRPSAAPAATTAAPAALAGKPEIADPWGVGSGAAGGGGMAATGAAAAGAGPWGAVAVQAANMLAKAREEREARKEAKQDVYAQFGADHSDFPQYGYNYSKKKRALDRQYGGAGISGFLKKLGIG